MTESLNTKTQEKSIDKQEDDLLRRGLDDIRARVSNLPKNKQEKELKKILKNYGISEHEFDWRDEEVEESKDGLLKKTGKVALVTGATLGLVMFNGINSSKKKNGVVIEKERLVVNPPPEKEKVDTSTIEINQRFKIEVYNSLTPEGKDVYTYFANYNPTPGRGYMMLDKKNATQYVFNDKNEIVAKLVAGLGKDTGDEQNTSYSFNTGKMTTPAGAYIVSNASKESDSREYGPMQYSLFGISTKGEKVYLGIHKTYPKDLDSRTEKLNTPSPSDNRFSNGCINIDVKDFETNIKPYFMGDGGEIMMILPDEGSVDSFRVDILVKKALELVVDIANQQEKELNSRLNQVNTEEDFIKIKGELEKIRIKRARAEKILEGK